MPMKKWRREMGTELRHLRLFLVWQWKLAALRGRLLGFYLLRLLPETILWGMEFSPIFFFIVLLLRLQLLLEISWVDFCRRSLELLELGLQAMLRALHRLPK